MSERRCIEILIYRYFCRAELSLARYTGLSEEIVRFFFSNMILVDQNQSRDFACYS